MVSISSHHHRLQKFVQQTATVGLICIPIRVVLASHSAYQRLILAPDATEGVQVFMNSSSTGVQKIYPRRAHLTFNVEQVKGHSTRKLI